MDFLKTKKRGDCLSEKLEVLINKRRLMEDTDYRDIFEVSSNFSCIQSEHLNNLAEYRSYLGSAPNDLVKAEQSIHRNSLYPSLDVEMKSTQNLNNLIKTSLQMFDEGFSLSSVNPVESDMIYDSIKQEEQFSHQLHRKTLMYQQMCLDVTKFVENLNTVRNSACNSCGSPKHISNLSSDSSFFATIRGDGVVASSSLLE